MFRYMKNIRSEEGSFTLEFLMVMPYYLFFLLLLWQAVASGLTIMQAQSAVHEAAKLYAITEKEIEAKEVAEKAIGNSEIMSFEDFRIEIPSYLHSNEFVAEVTLKHGLVFVPKEWRDTASITLTHKATGRILK